ncbi:MAG: hypothetical protein PHS20_01235 [Sphaerochaetaceae bacterium]|nr:hypothetical protein [Sphaerochaetaceae bacterium]
MNQRLLLILLQGIDMMKKLLFIGLLLAAVLFPAFSGAVSERGAWMLTHSTVNNGNSYFDVTETIDPTTTSTDFLVIPEDSGLFRTRTAFEEAITVTIDPGSDGWVFVHDDNTTIRRPYTIEIYQIEWTKSRRDANVVAGNPTTVQFNQDANGVVTFNMAAGTWGRDPWSLTIYCKKYYEYEVLLKFPAPSDIDLESGDYHASFTVSFPRTPKDSKNNDYSPVVTPTVDPVSIKGRYGESSAAASNGAYSFSIQSTADTFNMDLQNYGTCQNHQAAIVNFSAQESLSSTTQSEANSYSGKYQVLVSPFSDISLDISSENHYKFILSNSEQQTRSDINTVYYTLAKDSAGTALTRYDSNSYPNTFIVPVTFSTESTGGGNWYDNIRNWKLEWKINSSSIYISPIAPTNTSTIRGSGLYTSTIYFFVVTNT